MARNIRLTPSLEGSVSNKTGSSSLARKECPESTDISSKNS